MRTRKEIVDEYKSFEGMKLLGAPSTPERAKINNPKLLLEVLLDIRELLEGMNKKIGS